MEKPFLWIALFSLLLTLPYCGGSGSSTTPTPPVTPPAGTPSTYYLDCKVGANGSGTEANPWNALSSANAHPFIAGDRILLQRGTTCSGTLKPKGSGSSTAPITVDAYGTGPRPIIDGGMNEETVLLYDQQYWEISNLEIAGGNLYGIFIGGQNSTSLNHFRLTNLDVHGAHFQSVKRGDSGLVFIVSGGTGQVIHDVVVDGVVAHDSTVSEGIFIDAGGAYTGTNGAAQTLGNNITVQNSVAHDVAGDGILIMLLNNGLLQNNVVYNSGLCDNCTGSTPSGLWEWYCHTCIVQFNESYANQSWGGDGGGFDIDYYNNNNVVQYNYGHDSEGYCVSLFGSENTASINNVIRYNICANNAQKSSSAAQGEVFLFTWSGGKINGAQIYNNTFYWNPAGNAPLLVTSGATFAGSNPNFFKNNIIYSTVAGMVQTTSSLALDNNIYWTTAASPSWQYDGTTYTGFASYQSGSGQDAHGYFTDPLLNAPTQHEVGLPSTAFTQQAGSPAHGNGADVCQGISGCTMGARDFFGNALPAQGPFDIGAHQAP